MSIPYMGSKRKSASKIYQTIENFNPNSKIIVDLFCGGFAIGEKFLEKGDSINEVTFDYTDITAPPLHPNCECDLVPIFKSTKIINSVQNNTKSK